MIALASAILLFIGTYSDPSDSPPGGIYSLCFDTDKGIFSQPELAAATAKPTFLALHPNGRLLYATTDLSGFAGGADKAPNVFFTIPGSGKLRPTESGITGGLPLVHAGVDPTGRSLCVVSYRGWIESFPLKADGTPEKPASLIENKGPIGPQHNRQDRSHPHSVTLSPDGRRLYVCDLGLDRIYCYLLDPKTSLLTPADPSFTMTRPGMGPRHSKFSDDGRFLYVIGELDGTIATYACDSRSGSLSFLQRIPTLPADYSGPNTCAEIRIHPSGRFVYGSNRGHDSIAVFARNPSTGLLTLVEIVPCGGAHPRNFAISPNGDWLICANRDSNNLVAFRVDQQTGRLSQCGKSAQIPKPTCVLIMPPAWPAKPDVSTPL